MTRTVRLLFLALAGAAAASAQSDNATLNALLQEVRQLRIAIERTATLGPRMQLLLQRVQLQDGKVSRLARDLQDARGSANQAAGEAARLRSEISEAEERIRQEQNPAQKQQMEQQIRGAKLGLEEIGTREQQQRAREAELATQLRQEQATLDEFQAKLEKFEKSLEPPQ